LKNGDGEKTLKCVHSYRPDYRKENEGVKRRGTCEAEDIQRDENQVLKKKIEQ